jgi:hypothetical protein
MIESSREEAKKDLVAVRQAAEEGDRLLQEQVQKARENLSSEVQIIRLHTVVRVLKFRLLNSHPEQIHKRGMI